MNEPTPTLLANYHRRLTWRVRLARSLRHVAYRLDPDATVVRRATIDWNDRVLWVTPGPCEVSENQMLGAGGSIRSAPEFTGNRGQRAGVDERVQELEQERLDYLERQRQQGVTGFVEWPLGSGLFDYIEGEDE